MAEFKRIFRFEKLFEQNKTESADFLKKYFYGFCLFGVHLKNHISGKSPYCDRLLLNIPRIIRLICVIFTNVLYYRDMKNGTPTFVVYIPIMITSVPNLLSIANIDSCLTKATDIISALLETENHLKTHINVFVCRKALQRVLRMKFVLCVIVPSAFYCLKLYFRSPAFSFESDFGRLLLAIYENWASFLVLLLIEYRNFLLFSLNRKIKMSKLSYLDSNTLNLFHLFGHIQRVHSKIHHISTMINSHFGWLLLMILLDYFNIITSSVLYVFINIVDPQFRLRIARNYK